MDDLEEQLRELSDSELVELLEQTDPMSKTWEIAIDWFGESKLLGLGVDL